MSPDTIAGVISTSMFAGGNVPMLLKALRTRSLASYSHTYLLMNCTANLVHWIYVLGLPFGPIWFLHGFHTAAMALMLVWYLRFECSRVGLWLPGILSGLASRCRDRLTALETQPSLELSLELAVTDVLNRGQKR